ERVETVRLTEIFRQAQQSLIVTNAHRVNRGELPQLRVQRETQSDFYFIEAEEPEKAVSLIRELVKRRLPRAFHLNPLDDIQVMTPMHRGTAGVANLNAELQGLLNANGKGLVRGGRLLQVNDKVM
ncbi:MAG: ATP-dependent RecD-like DNA helicase, partial [Dehalococcoidales bacterium]|nr:ATP-dependent RecD-like DNA helicase [Dehalococcoidales bacterium]